MMIMKGIYCFMLLFMIGLFDASELSMASKNLKVEKNLSHLNNKAPLKSIKSKDGDVIDCFHISQQPALDHPLLENHEIQMRPTYHPDELFTEKKISNLNSKDKDDKKPIAQLWHSNGKCPEGTVPIRRTRQDRDILTTSSIKRYGKKKSKSIVHLKKSADTESTKDDGHEYAAAFVEGDKYCGAKATMSVWGPHLQQFNEFSSAQLWIAGYSNSDLSTLNAIEVGWMVSPNTYGDNKTRIFSYWTSDNFQSTGCFDVQCSGFVQIDSEMALGASLTPLSTINVVESVLTVSIWKDAKQNAWWLQVQDTLIGYWPASLFTHLADSASLVEWGGQVFNSKPDGLHTTTQMGNGHFPEDGVSVASTVKNLQVAYRSSKLQNPRNIGTFVTKPNCYNLTLGKSDDEGYFISYGGPGRNPNCP